jgi:tripartite-type tricarboxylate transporter receptor subunit TctC
MNTSIRIPLSPALLRWAAAAATAALALGLQPAWSQPYPARPVKIVVGYSAGGAVDIVARTWARPGKQMGQPFVVENKPGAGTNIAVKYVIDAKPDGYTLLMAANALAANMALYQPQPFDAEKDLVPWRW